MRRYRRGMESPPKPKRPRDPNQLAKAIVGKAAGRAPLDKSEPEPEPEKNPAAVALGRLGGKKGGKARAATFAGQLQGKTTV